MILPWTCLRILLLGLMVAGQGFSSVGGFEVAGAGVYLPASEVAFDSLVWGVAEEYGDARLERVMQTALSLGVLITFMLLVGCWIVAVFFEKKRNAIQITSNQVKKGPSTQIARNATSQPLVTPRHLRGGKR